MRSLPANDAQTLQYIVSNEEDSLVRAAQADPAAFGRLYQRHLDRVYAYIRTRTNSEADAADLTQQVFLRALDGLPRYRGSGAEGAFAAWLFRIARNAIIDTRRHKREVVAWDLIPETLHPHSDEGLDAPLEHDEALTRLSKLFAALDVETRELLVLRFTANLTSAQIAQVIGKSEAATQKLLSRTIRKLKEQYHDDTR